MYQFKTGVSPNVKKNTIKFSKLPDLSESGQTTILFLNYWYVLWFRSSMLTCYTFMAENRKKSSVLFIHGRKE